MDDYSYTVRAIARNEVLVVIRRGGSIAYTIYLEPIDIGVSKALCMALFSCTTRVQRVLLRKGHEIAKAHIENMKEFEK